MTNSLEYSPFEEADSLLGNQGIHIHFMEPMISSPCSQNPATWPCLEADYPFHITPVYFLRPTILLFLHLNLGIVFALVRLIRTHVAYPKLGKAKKISC